MQYKKDTFKKFSPKSNDVFVIEIRPEILSRFQFNIIPQNYSFEKHKTQKYILLLHEEDTNTRN